MNIGTILSTWFSGKYVGKDQYGNRYYESRNASQGKRKRRWVMYKGVVEASKVPPRWHGWLHYTTDILPTEERYEPHDWEKPHLPNLTGTTGVYLPPGHVLGKAKKRKKATGDYQSWEAS